MSFFISQPKFDRYKVGLSLAAFDDALRQWGLQSSSTRTHTILGPHGVIKNLGKSVHYVRCQSVNTHQHVLLPILSCQVQAYVLISASLFAYQVKLCQFYISTATSIGGLIVSTVLSPNLGSSNRRRGGGRRMRIAEDVLCDTSIAIEKVNRGANVTA